MMEKASLTSAGKNRLCKKKLKNVMSREMSMRRLQLGSNLAEYLRQ